MHKEQAQSQEISTPACGQGLDSLGFTAFFRGNTPYIGCEVTLKQRRSPVLVYSVKNR